MIVDIDKKNNNFKLMNILQLKWILYNLIQKKYKIQMILQIKDQIFKNIIKIYIFH